MYITYVQYEKLVDIHWFESDAHWVTRWLLHYDPLSNSTSALSSRTISRVEMFNWIGEFRGSNPFTTCFTDRMRNVCWYSWCVWEYSVQRENARDNRKLWNCHEWSSHKVDWMADAYTRNLTHIFLLLYIYLLKNEGNVTQHNSESATCGELWESICQGENLTVRNLYWMKFMGEIFVK